MPTIWICDDEAEKLRYPEKLLRGSGYRVETFSRGADLLKRLETAEAAACDIVLQSVCLPDMDALLLLKQLHGRNPDLPVIFLTGHGTINEAVQAIKEGAYDYITKPFPREKLLGVLERVLDHRRLANENLQLRKELRRGGSRTETMVFRSARFREVYDLTLQVAESDANIMILGESGTGKELIAGTIHANSQRAGRPFVSINCAALPDTLLESQLFGHVRGAFTGAVINQKGLIEEADGGTLFLDEAGNLPMNVQKTLLRFLQEQEFLRIGDTTPTKVDVRIISATNAELKEAVKSGAFREDLYYRLNVLNLHLPPLRERRADIPLLAAHFITLQNKKFGTAIKGLAPDALEAVMEFSWPGNIRQLKNVIEACTAMENGDYLSLPVLSQFIEIPLLAGGDEEGVAGELEESDYSQALSRFEIDYLKGLLRKNHGNVEAAARDAGMNMATIYRKLKKYNIRREDYV